MEVALAYSGVDRQRGTVLEVMAGRVDVGASIGFLSQYPAEEEFLMPPLSCLEVFCPFNAMMCVYSMVLFI